MRDYVTLQGPYHYLCREGVGKYGQPLTLSMRLRGELNSEERKAEAEEMLNSQWERFQDYRGGSIEINPFGQFQVPTEAQMVNARHLATSKITRGPLSNKFYRNLLKG